MCQPEEPLRYDSCVAVSVGGGGAAEKLLKCVDIVITILTLIMMITILTLITILILIMISPGGGAGA